MNKTMNIKQFAEFSVGELSGRNGVRGSGRFIQKLVNKLGGGIARKTREQISVFSNEEIHQFMLEIEIVLCEATDEAVKQSGHDLLNWAADVVIERLMINERLASSLFTIFSEKELYIMADRLEFKMLEAALLGCFDTAKSFCRILDNCNIAIGEKFNTLD